MAAETRRIVIVYDDLTDVVSAHLADAAGGDVDRASADSYLLLDKDVNGAVVGVEIMGASALIPSRWRTHPDRPLIPSAMLQELDRWFEAHWADTGRTHARQA
jgi:uncharacterized protein YuzE